jgi:hypothetical protein
MNPTELFPPDREEFLQKAKAESTFARREAETFEELIQRAGTDEAKNVLKCMARIAAQRYQTQIDVLERAARTWIQHDIEDALLVLHPNLAPA